MRKEKKTKQKNMDWDSMIKKMHEIFQNINDSAKQMEESLKKLKESKQNYYLVLPS